MVGSIGFLFVGCWMWFVFVYSGLCLVIVWVYLRIALLIFFFFSNQNIFDHHPFYLKCPKKILYKKIPKKV